MWVAKQDVHLFPKVNKTRQKCQGNCVDGMSEGRVTTLIATASGKLCNDLRFSICSVNEVADRRVTKYHTALGAGLVPDGPGLRERERLELYETR